MMRKRDTPAKNGIRRDVNHVLVQLQIELSSIAAEPPKPRSPLSTHRHAGKTPAEVLSQQVCAVLQPVIDELAMQRRFADAVLREIAKPKPSVRSIKSAADRATEPRASAQMIRDAALAATRETSR